MARISAVCSTIKSTIEALDVSSYTAGFPVSTAKEAVSGDLLEPGLASKHLSFIVEPSTTTPINRARSGCECSTPINVIGLFLLRPGYGNGGKPVDSRLARDFGEDVAAALMELDGTNWTLTLDAIDLDGPDAEGSAMRVQVALTCIHRLGG